MDYKKYQKKQDKPEEYLQINEHIKENDLRHAYLLYGEEQQVVKIFRNKLLKALMGTDSLEELKQDMNFSLFVGAPLDTASLIEVASSYPFMGEKRVILVENSKAFYSENRALADCICNLPETTYIIFCELDVQKRKSKAKNKNEDASSEDNNTDTNTGDASENDESAGKKAKSLFDAVKKVGYTCEIQKQKVEFIENWIVRNVGESGKRISRGAMETLIERTGPDLLRISNELEKLISYKGEEQDIKVDDVCALVAESPTSTVFNMLDAVADRNLSQAMNYYADLMELKVSPQDIYRLMERHMRILYQVKDMREKGFPASAISDRIKEVPSYFVNKYMKQASKFSGPEIMECLKDCVDLNLNSRTGALTDRMGVELILTKYSRKSEKA